MKLYNTLTKQVDDILPLDDQAYHMYSCGPTVYDHAHIGNLSAYIFADTLRRALKLDGHAAKHVMNYTDVDDKTIRRSREQYPDMEPREALKKLTDKYIDIFRDDMQRVGNDLAAITFVRATDTIDAMKDLITRLHDAGFAYIADDGVYFSIEAYRKSGKTYGQLLELTAQNTSEARIHNDEYDKESAHDFALWKTQKDGEPAWEFTLDGHDLAGRPGWHIECSVMSRPELGQPFDLHTGGIDLIFPHHENEIAQSTALEENPVMATCFAHNEHILVDGKKMAKSAQNFFTLQDIVDKGFDPLAFRLLILQSHYRNPVNFSWESLEAAQNRLMTLRSIADLRFQAVGALNMTRPDFVTVRQRISECMQDDLDTPGVLKEIAAFVVRVTLSGIASEEMQGFVETLAFLDGVLGLQLLQSADITGEQKHLIIEREQARGAKEWARSDELRQQLQAQDIGVRDTPAGAIWYRL